jgi:uncharacterized protein (DUF1778 family)
MATAKTARLEVRLTKEHKRLLEQAAAVTGQTLSSFTASTLIARAREVVEGYFRTTLSPRDWERFLEIIEEKEPPPELVEAVRRHFED